MSRTMHESGKRMSWAASMVTCLFCTDAYVTTNYAYWKGVKTIFICQARHYVQEDHPEIIGRAINDWRQRQD